jgi:hypothetical protein
VNKTLTTLLAATTVAVSLSATTMDASAWWRGGWGPGFAAGVIGGAVIAGIIASRPPGYVVYPGYAQPLYAANCYWAAQPIYDRWGRVVGYSGQPVQVCPGYAAPVVAAPPPAGYYAGPPAELPPK